VTTILINQQFTFFGSTHQVNKLEDSPLKAREVPVSDAPMDPEAKELLVHEQVRGLASQGHRLQTLASRCSSS
jgi:hypothetical protein